MMRRGVRTNRIILALIFLIIAVFGVSRTCSIFSRTGSVINSVNPLGSQQINQAAELSTEALNELQITSVSSDITVTLIESDRVEARLTGSAASQPRLVADADGGKGTIKVEWPRKNILFPRDMRLEVTLPYSYGESLQVVTVSGDIILPEIRSIRMLRGESVSGEITAGNFSAEKLNLSTVSGDIHLTEAVIGEAALSSTSGECSISGEILELSVSTVSGDVHAELDALSGPVELSTTSGKVQLAIPKESSAAVVFKTDSGDFSSEIPVSATKSGNKSLEGTIGSGLYKVEAGTVSGDVSIHSY